MRVRHRPRIFALLACVLAAGGLLAGCVTVVTPLGDGDNTLHETTVGGTGRAKILWLPITGFISDKPTRQTFGLVSTPSMLERVSQALDKAAKDRQVKAVVLRIDSPGGTVAASDEIYDRIKRYEAATGIPVIASLGGVAASGGYYVAMAGHPVIAGPTTITGSIGVIIVDLNAAGLLAKFGLSDATVTSGPHKDILSPLRKPTADEHAIVQRVVDSLFARFVSVVEENRPALDHSQLATITDGRIFAADDAKRLGLVDAIGHIDDVLAAARQAAGVSRARVVRYYRGNSAPATLDAAAAETIEAPASHASIMEALGDLDRFSGEPLYLWTASAP